METIQSEQFTIDGNKDPSVKESLFYMIFLLTIYPMIMGLLNDYFALQHLSETAISTMGITGSIDTLTTALSAVFAIGAQAVCAKYVGSRDEKKSSEAYTSILLTETGILLFTAAAIVCLRLPLARLIGADADAGLLQSTSLAIALFAIGMPGSALTYLLTVLLYMDDRTRKGVLWGTLLNGAASIAGLLIVTWTNPSMAGYMTCGFAGDWINVFFLLFYKQGRSRFFVFRKKDYSFKRFLRIFQVGLPGGLEYAYYAAYQFITFLFIVRRFSTEYMAVIEIREDISSIDESLLIGMGALLVERIGISVGSGDTGRIRKETRNAWIACTAIAVAAGFLLAFLYPRLADLFLGDIGANRDKILYHADYFLICTCIGLPFYVGNNIFTSIYEVREMLAHAHVSYFLEIFGMVTIYSLALGTLIGIKGVWIAYPLAEATVFVLNIVLLILHTGDLPRRWLDLSFPKSATAEKGAA